jgi:para-aminobenzoate synthetase component 1
MQIKKLPFTDPLKFAEKISANYGEKNWVFLYSALSKDVKSSSSLIALFPKEEIITESFKDAEKIIPQSKRRWFGYLSYELGRQFEKLPKTKKSFIDLPKIHLVNFALILEFDHANQKLIANFEDEKLLNKVLGWSAKKPSPQTPAEVLQIDSNFTNSSYLEEIRDIKKMIAAGDFYQTNLTRKFFGEFNKKLKSQDHFQLFKKLTKSSPANYMSFLKLAGTATISSSPELFLEIKNGKILSRPIKGTTPRSTDKKEDQKNKLFLRKSSKERAENLMIVDLVRNDLARVCKAGSVKGKNLFKITSYKTVHHMSSEIIGKIDREFTIFDCIKNCFPAGSMTGAPKIKAMIVAQKKEKLNRGIYSGAIGFIDGDEAANLSVVIRTLIVKEKKFEFQVGGAITYESDPESELLETFSKAKALLKLLKL